VNLGYKQFGGTPHYGGKLRSGPGFRKGQRVVIKV
jgi:hypothetical protein